MNHGQTIRVQRTIGLGQFSEIVAKVTDMASVIEHIDLKNGYITYKRFFSSVISTLGRTSITICDDDHHRSHYHGRDREQMKEEPTVINVA